MNLNRNEDSRRRGLAFSLDLIAGYEANELRVREHNPLYIRTPEEIHRECDQYRREAHRVWDIPWPDAGTDSPGAWDGGT